MTRFLPCAAALLLLLTGPAVLAQNTPASTAQPGPNVYAGPRFAGGPDSLRTVLQRALRPAGPYLTGQLFMRLELNQTGQPNNYYLLPPADQASAVVARRPETKVLLQQLATRLSPWQLGTSTNRSQPGNIMVLPLDFGPLPEPLPLLYSDENPVFFGPVTKKDSRPMGALEFIQRQFRYPADALRNGVQGTAYVYFEVSETGAVEHRRLASGLSPSVDTEILRALNTLPTATTPPRQQGQPVRVAYVLPINLRIQ